MPAGYRAVPEQAMLFTIAAWDCNCPQHIPSYCRWRFLPPPGNQDLRIAELEARHSPIQMPNDPIG